MQSARGNFTVMLKEVSGRFQDTAASYEAVQELEHTIASLQQIKNGLEETKEYRAAQAEKERASKGDRVQQLQKRVEESKAAAERLLGFPLTLEHCTSGKAYSLMPDGFVDRTQFEVMIQDFQNQIASTEAFLDKCKGELRVLKSPNYKPRGCVRVDQELEQAQRAIHNGEHQLRAASSRLLGYMMSHQPMLDATFSDTLAAHLDAMLDAYLELRKLQA